MKKRARGSKKKGHSYEEHVGRELRRLGLDPISGAWFEFFDVAGRGLAQPDHFILRPTHIVLIECKLSQTQTAFLQMAQLYAPLLERYYDRPVVCLQACRNLRYPPEADREPVELAQKPEFGNFTWHWLGR